MTPRSDAAQLSTARPGKPNLYNTTPAEVVATSAPYKNRNNGLDRGAVDLAKTLLKRALTCIFLYRLALRQLSRTWPRKSMTRESDGGSKNAPSGDCSAMGSSRHGPLRDGLTEKG